MKRFFKIDEIPVEQLKKVGISEEAMLDLPPQVMDRILTGRLSPLLRLKTEMKDGRTAEISAKLSLQRTTEGEVMVMVHPIRKNIKNDLQLNERQLMQLEEGKTIRISGNTDVFVQMDRETKCLMTAKAEEIKIPTSIGNVQLGNEQINRIREGNPIEIEVDNTKVTLGIDLNSFSGFKTMKGDLQEWMQKKMETWDRITPGATGIWRTTENGWQYEQTRKQNNAFKMKL